MIEIEKDGTIAMQIFTLVTSLNRTIAVANSTGLRVEIEVTNLQRRNVPWGDPLLSAHVFRPLAPERGLTKDDEPHAGPDDAPRAA